MSPALSFMWRPTVDVVSSAPAARPSRYGWLRLLPAHATKCHTAMRPKCATASAARHVQRGQAHGQAHAARYLCSNECMWRLCAMRSANAYQARCVIMKWIHSAPMTIEWKYFPKWKSKWAKLHSISILPSKYIFELTLPTYHSKAAPDAPRASTDELEGGQFVGCACSQKHYMGSKPTTSRVSGGALVRRRVHSIFTILHYQ